MISLFNHLKQQNYEENFYDGNGDSICCIYDAG